MKLIKRIYSIKILLLCLTTLFMPIQVMASGNHGGGHDHAAEEEEKGPNGGRLLSDGELSIEMKIFEAGVPPEMRIYSYWKGELIKPQEMMVQVTLDRLGGIQDPISFEPEKDYLVGDQEVVEPHSFDVTVMAYYQNKSYHWHFASHEGRAEISDRLLKKSDVRIEKVGPQNLTFNETLFGVVEVPQDKQYQLHAPYAGLVKSILVKPGDKVSKGQQVAILFNSKTLTEYPLVSPASGEVTQINLNTGDNVNETAILEIVDLSEVWVNLSAFPENVEKLALGQKVTVYDLHHHELQTSEISYIAPKMTGGHIARARTIIKNLDGHWRPGMHVKADIETKTKLVSLAVKSSAIQNFRDMPVVFAKFGNTFEVRMVKLGEQAGDYIEVLGGIIPGTEYVTNNSFLLKAEVLKDGASHDH
ncbi:MAG: efflux RND transporter periplasmic adaptor subunit [Kangiellaceae bacterium]|nr:efflux RND transporter periplasmic adaptor subunit [Kangiellaceae bacterium]